MPIEASRLQSNVLSACSPPFRLRHHRGNHRYGHAIRTMCRSSMVNDLVDPWCFPGCLQRAPGRAVQASADLLSTKCSGTLINLVEFRLCCDRTAALDAGCCNVYLLLNIVRTSQIHTSTVIQVRDYEVPRQRCTPRAAPTNSIARHHVRLSLLRHPTTGRALYTRPAVFLIAPYHTFLLHSCPARVHRPHSAYLHSYYRSR